MHRHSFLALLAAPALLAQDVEPRVETQPTKPVAQSLRDAVEELSAADLQALLTILRENYIAPEKLDDTAIARATALGIFERFAPGITLPLGAETKPVEDSPLRSEILEQRIGYLRLGALGEERLSELDAVVRTFAERALPALILDLRATPAGSHFELAAKICERFVPKGRVLFTVRRPHAQQELILTSKLDPLYRGVIVTLTDADTTGAAEVIAAVLRAQAKALVIGQLTRGEAVEYAEVPLPSGRKIRVAVAEAALPESVPVFPGGVAPDIAVAVSAEENARVLQAALQSGVAPLVTESERPRMNEAALVAGTNPEIEAHRAALASKGRKTSLPLRDAALQRALDAITTIALYEKPAAQR
jgi:hypothetical protein